LSNSVLSQHAGSTEFLADRQKGTGWCRQIKQAIAAGLARGLQLVELIAHRIE
jgi:hypothetical protein